MINNGAVFKHPVKKFYKYSYIKLKNTNYIHENVFLLIIQDL